MPLARGSVRGALLGIGASGVGTVGLVLVVFACVSRTATPFLVGGGEGQAAASVGDDPVASPALGPGGTGGTAGPIDAQDLDEGEPEDGATGEPGTENPDPGEHAEPVASGDGWVSDLHLVHGQDPVDWYRWTPKNELLYLTPHGYEIFGDDGSRQIAGEDLEIALEQTSRAWEHKKAKWTVEFDVYRPDGILDCDETQDVVEARFDVCMRKAKTRCNTVTFLQTGEMGFPWSPDDLGVGLEGLDLVAFPKGPHVILGRRDMIILF